MQLIAGRDAVRSANLARLRSLGFAPVAWMPLREHRAIVRPNDEIAARAVALAALAMWITDDRAPSAEILAHVSRGGLRDALDADERALFDAPRSSAAIDDPIWDAVGMLGWIVGLDHEPAADGAAMPDAARVDVVRWLYRGGDVHPSTLAPRTRSADEIVPLEDLFTCAHQASRLAQLGFTQGPRRAHHERIEVRRHALTWALSPSVAWQEVDLSS